MRILAWVVLLDVGLAGLMLGIGIFVARTELVSAFDSSLHQKTLSLRALVRYPENNSPRLIFDPTGLPPSADAVHPDMFAIYLSDGTMLAHSPGWNGLPPGARLSGGGIARFRQAGVPFRALVMRDIEILDREDESGRAGAKITVVYASTLLGVRQRVWRVGLYLGAACLLLVAVAAWLTVWTIRRSLAPLHELAARAGGITVRQWSFEAPPAAAATPELRPLTQALETLISRLHDSFARQREFTSDLAHELKTAVAIIKSSLQVLLQAPRTALDYHAGAEALLGDCERLESLVERMLRLARAEQFAEHGTPRQVARADLMSTCDAALSRVAALANSKDVQLKLEGISNAQVAADPDDLELVWVNLLDNAVRYSPPGSTVTLRLSDLQNRRAALCVDDSGEGIPAEDLPNVFERFRRGNGVFALSAGGFGLGLAICKTIIEAYGGSIELESQPGRGTRVRVELPVVTAEAEGMPAHPQRVWAVEAIKQHPVRPDLRTPTPPLVEACQPAHPDTLPSVPYHSERARG
jgi:signal transduction histidine kinase